MTHPPRSAASSAETVAWLLALLTVVGLYVTGATLGPEWFGINQFRKVPSGAVAMLAAAAILAIAAAVAFVPRFWPGWVDSYPLAILAALVAGVVMFTAPSNFRNLDAQLLASKIEGAVPISGAFITHDEMLELLVHSRVWDYTHRWWGWSVELVYQVLGAIAGAAFVVLAFRLARRLAPAVPGLFLLGLMAGGYMQLFFGDVENYTLTAAMVTAYLLASVRFLRGDAALWEPTVMLALATAFHLLGGWLLPSLAYLALVQWRRTRDLRPIVRSAAIFPGVLALTVAVVHLYGQSIWTFGSSQAGRALRMMDMLVTEWSSPYYFDQVNLLQLLCPAVALVVALAWWRRLIRDEIDAFLAIATACMMLLQFVWKSQIGVYQDWNLYASGAIVLSVWIWRSVGIAATSTVRLGVAAALAAAGAMHSYAWIAANHAFGR